MRCFLPFAVGLLGLLGCSLPTPSNPSVVKMPAIPYLDQNGPVPSLSDGSLWQDRPMVADLRARRLNDLVTIRITENSTAKVTGDLNTSRNGANSLKATSFLDKVATLGMDSKGTSLSTPVTSGTTTSFKGAGSTDRTAVFTSTVTARVVRVLDNGNLIFEGFRDIQLNNETQRLYVAGMINPMLLDVNNSIASSQVAELKLGYGGQGVVDETTRPGYASRLLNYIWPF
ncbi:MAG: flagellar basal body L-ring protein FlgH [Holophaga sp.]|nr:flagellar basal body L-ring protein FlgH [Holophaga sp.]